MRYSYEFKLKCIEMYREGKLPNTPDGIERGSFRRTVRKWVRLEELHGPDALKHKNHDKQWTPEEKLELVARVIAGKSYLSVAIEAGIPYGMLYQWVRRYRIEGYNGLVNKKRGRQSKESPMKKKTMNIQKFHISIIKEDPRLGNFFSFYILPILYVIFYCGNCLIYFYIF